MRAKSTWRLLAAVLAVGAVLWMVERRFRLAEQQRLQEAHVLAVVADNVERLAIARGEFRVELVKRGSRWFVERPLKARADDRAVSRLLNMVEDLQRREVITPEQRAERELGMDDYGLADPRVRLDLQSAESRSELWIGADAPLGELLYVKEARSPDVMATTRALLEVIPGKLEDVRDRVVLEGQVTRTLRMEIERPGAGFIQLMRTPQGWMIQQPSRHRARNDMIEEILDALYALRVRRFVWDPAGEAGGPAPGAAVSGTPVGPVQSHGLAADEAAARIRVWSGGDEAGRELVLGKRTGEEGLVYAKRADEPSVYAVDTRMLDAVKVGVNELRDPVLFPFDAASVVYVSFQEGEKKVVLRRRQEEGWTVTEPVQRPADREVVTDLVNRLVCLSASSFREGSLTNLPAWGLDPPAFRVAVGVPGAEPDRVAGEGVLREGRQEATPARGIRPLLVGAAVEGRDTVLARFEGDDKELFDVPVQAVRAFGEHPADLLGYLDRSVLALNPAGIRRISLARNEKLQTVARDGEGGWKAVEPADAEVDSDAVGEILFLMNNLRALRIEAHHPESLVPYGLAGSGPILTLGLAGKEGIQKSVMIGFRARTDGVYAMVQGQDVVFVLDKQRAHALLRDLVKQGAAEQESS